MYKKKTGKKRKGTKRRVKQYNTPFSCVEQKLSKIYLIFLKTAYYIFQLTICQLNCTDCTFTYPIGIHHISFQLVTIVITSKFCQFFLFIVRTINICRSNNLTTISLILRLGSSRYRIVQINVFHYSL